MLKGNMKGDALWCSSVVLLWFCGKGEGGNSASGL